MDYYDMDYYDDEDYPAEPEYPPIIPGELTACLGEAQEMREECGRLKSTLDKALEQIRLTKRALDGETWRKNNHVIGGGVCSLRRQ